MKKYPSKSIHGTVLNSFHAYLCFESNSREIYCPSEPYRLVAIYTFVHIDMVSLKAVFIILLISFQALPNEAKRGGGGGGFRGGGSSSSKGGSRGSTFGGGSRKSGSGYTTSGRPRTSLYSRSRSGRYFLHSVALHSGRINLGKGGKAIS